MREDITSLFFCVSLDLSSNLSKEWGLLSIGFQGGTGEAISNDSYTVKNKGTLYYKCVCVEASSRMTVTIKKNGTTVKTFTHKNKDDIYADSFNISAGDIITIQSGNFAGWINMVAMAFYIQ